MNAQRKGLYRSDKRIVSGVCSGISEYFDFSVKWVRIAFLILLIASGGWPMIGAYIIAALIIKPAPAHPIQNEEEREFYNSYVNAPGSSAERLKHHFDQLDKRIRRMEDTVTARAYEWEQRLRKN